MSDSPLVTFESILDNDFYKFTMQQAVFQLFPESCVRYQFINRGKHVYPEGFATVLKSAILEMSRLQLSDDEKAFLINTCPYLKRTYLDFLQGYRYDPSEITVEQKGGDLQVYIEGMWYRTILWEVPLMALICELYYKMTGESRQTNEEVVQVVQDKMKKYSELGITIADFGSRRRYSYEVHQIVVHTSNVCGLPNFVGTSNVYLSYLNGTKPIGTHAHEWFMFHGAVFGYKSANISALQNWTTVYQGDLGIALTDTFTTDVFLRDFDKKYAKLFDGVRHDSGDPVVFAAKIINHYRDLGINPLTKTIIFSDGLNYEKVAKITAYCKNKIGFSFGVGTNLSNDVGVKPMNIVIKLTNVLQGNWGWIDAVKLSDVSMKHTGTLEAVDVVKRSLVIE
jgi:nicotinate phosphoribosyltransferase